MTRRLDDQENRLPGDKKQHYQAVKVLEVGGSVLSPVLQVRLAAGRHREEQLLVHRLPVGRHARQQKLIREPI